MSLVAQRSRLRSLAHDLALRWDETKSSWRDSKSEEFERRFLAELGPRVEKSVEIIEKLDELLTKVRKDCE
jgi:hypothetical protein